MTKRALRSSILCLATIALAGCNFGDLLSTNNSEQVAGRGSKVFDPYSGNSGAIRLSLQSFNGCSVLVSGETIQKGTANIPYPGSCENPLAADPTTDSVTPSGTMRIVAGRPYFLNQLSLTQALVNKHTNFADPTEAANWFANQSDFKGLDWDGLSITLDDWIPFPGSFTREVHFDNANWQLNRDDSFLVEVLDDSGTVRASQTYQRQDFLTESSVAGHSRVTWSVEGLGAPQFPGDKTAHQADPYSPITYRTTFRVDLDNSTDPFKQISIPDGLSGDGAFRVTWSQLPNKPFYFPVKFVENADRPKTCLPADGGTEPVACGFGLKPELSVTRPANGKGYYEPGETFQLFVQGKDDDGNLLHPPDSLPSYLDFLSGDSNGITYYSQAQVNEQELDSDSVVNVIGPIQELRPYYVLDKPAPYYVAQNPGSLVDSVAAVGGVPGLASTRWPTRQSFTLPPDAKPGTYVAMLKMGRQYFGERLTRTTAKFIQVGQAEKTNYPGRVGNCQICHRGVVSMENVRHGLSVDHIEACKGCHYNRLSVEIHEIHYRSPKYPLAKNDCTTCHLTRESAVRPSYDVCSSCHPSVHGSEYAQLQYTVLGTTSRFSNCAQSCHVQKTPALHMLPPQ
jgi:hypothetical protein